MGLDGGNDGEVIDDEVDAMGVLGEGLETLRLSRTLSL